MQCEQIRKYLAEYVAGELPGYKKAWVAQHLAGCDACRAEAEGERQSRSRWKEQEGVVPVAVTAEPQPWARATRAPRGYPGRGTGGRVRRPAGSRDPGGAMSGALQRPVPRRVRWLGALLLLALTAGGAWVVWAALNRPDLLPLPEAFRRPGVVSALAGVRPVVESVTAIGDRRYIKVRFSGRDLLPPGQDGSWVAVYDDRWRELKARVALVRIDNRSLTAEVVVDAPEEPTRLHIRIHGVDQVVPQRWKVTLPPPPSEVETFDQRLSGALAHVTLLRYGLDGDWLYVEMAADDGGSSVPELTLQDGSGLHLAPREQRRIKHPFRTVTLFRYQLPDGVQPPVALVGTGQIRKRLGPWTIPTGMLE